MTILPIRACGALLIVLSFVSSGPARGAEQKVDANGLFKSAVNHWLDLVEPSNATPKQTVSLNLKIAKADGLPREAVGATVELAYQFPDRFRAAAVVGGERHVV